MAQKLLVVDVNCQTIGFDPSASMCNGISWEKQPGLEMEEEMGDTESGETSSDIEQWWINLTCTKKYVSIDRSIRQDKMR